MTRRREEGLTGTRREELRELHVEERNYRNPKRGITRRREEILNFGLKSYAARITPWLRVRLGGAGPDDLTHSRATHPQSHSVRSEVVTGGTVLWGLLGLPPHCPCFIVPLRVRLWVGLHGWVLGLMRFDAHWLAARVCVSRASSLKRRCRPYKGRQTDPQKTR